MSVHFLLLIFIFSHLTTPLVHPPLLLRKLYPSLIWKLPAAEKVLYLTFDDGPIPEATPFVLDSLKFFNAKATFFCLGKNVKANPALYERILQEGHTTGNHTYNHLNGWKTSLTEYLDNIEQCRTLVDSALFRPPYGKIRSSQIQSLKNNMHIIMWDVLSYDFKQDISPEQCAENVLQNVDVGSIIVFHDSIKAFKNMSATLPVVLQQLSEKGYRFETIPKNLPLQSQSHP